MNFICTVLLLVTVHLINLWCCRVPLYACMSNIWNQSMVHIMHASATMLALHMLVHFWRTVIFVGFYTRNAFDNYKITYRFAIHVCFLLRYNTAFTQSLTHLQVTTRIYFYEKFVPHFHSFSSHSLFRNYELKKKEEKEYLCRIISCF